MTGEPISLADKMLAMAQADESPNEQRFAREWLRTRGMWPPPPRPPVAVSAPAPEPDPRRGVWVSTDGANWHNVESAGFSFVRGGQTANSTFASMASSDVSFDIRKQNERDWNQWREILGDQ